jgi:conjugal transfer mating pair stabilization protein TraN
MRPALVLLLRRAVVWFTLACFVTTQTVRKRGPHAEEVARARPPTR